jgi:hypothetical protein
VNNAIFVLEAREAALLSMVAAFSRAGSQAASRARKRAVSHAKSNLRLRPAATRMALMASPAWLVLGEAVAIHIDRKMIENGVYQTAQAHPILRGGGPADYFEIDAAQLFKLERPQD